MAPIKGKFSENEKVFCYHGPLLYEAKCVKLKKDGNNVKYFIHYQGWNKHWDEWAGEDRILKLNDENREKMKQIFLIQQAKKKDKKKLTPKPGKKSKSGTDSANTSRASTPVSDRSFKATPGPTGSSGRRPFEEDAQSTSSREDESEREPRRKKYQTSTSLTAEEMEEESEDEVQSTSTQPEKKTVQNFKTQIPEELQYVLASDWDLMHRSLFILPAKVTVSSIIDDYLKQATKIGDPEFTFEFMNGMKTLFDYVVDSRLIYSYETKQIEALLNQGDTKKRPVDIFGSIHLLRMMVIIDEFLNDLLSLEDYQIKAVQAIVANFLEYLDSIRPKIFTSKNYSSIEEIASSLPT